jgi:VWFA-related protein
MVVVRPAVGTLLGVALFALPAFAQAPYSEKIEVSITNVDVTVTDHGKPVRGLTRGDFEVFEDGVGQPITGFYAIESVEAAPVPQPVEERFRRKVLVMIDVFSTTVFNRDRAMARLEEFINDRFRAGEYDWSIAAVDTDLRVLLPPTSDKKAIHEALNQIRANRVPLLASNSRGLQFQPTTLLDAFAAAVEARNDARAEEDHVEAIVEAVRAFGATTGKKVILFVTGQNLPTEREPRSWADFLGDKQLTSARDRLIR